MRSGDTQLQRPRQNNDSVPPWLAPRIWTSFLISLPDFIPVVVAPGDFQGHQSSPPRFGPELAAPLEPALELAAQGFHRSAADGTAFRRPRRVMDMGAMIFKIFDFGRHRRRQWLFPLDTSGRQVLQGLEHAGFAAVPQLVQDRFRPSPPALTACAAKN